MTGDWGWYDEARFGLFVHWSHSSQRGCEVSWPLVGGGGVPGVAIPSIPVDEYHATADTFCPEPGAARQWLRLAREAGMGYAVLTTKHHDGFALWPTAYGDWSIARTPYEGDLVAEFVDACRAEGLRVGLYFSLPDWHHPDYPAFTETDKPYAFAAYRRADPEAWDRFVETMFGQVRELLTNYGRIDVLWFDLPFERTAAEWRAGELLAMIRELQPGILVNDRLPGAADFATPEQFIPPQPPGGRWETCMTMNDTWAFNPDDHAYKSATSLVHALCEVAGRGGNFLLNVGPDGAGRLPAEQVERLTAIARWMDRHGDAIRGTQPALEPWQFYGPTTRRGDRLYLHLLWRPYERITVRGIRTKRVRAARVLGSPAPLTMTERCSVIDLLVNPDPVGELVIDVPAAAVDPVATVIELELTGDL